MDEKLTPTVRWLVWSATGLSLLVVVLGAYVRLKDAGLACPDWPGCFGNMIVPSSGEHMEAGFPGVMLNTEKAWIEMIHRYAAATLGLLILVIFALSFRARSAARGFPLLPSLLLVLVIGQGLLGMWTVTAQLKPVIVTLHLLGGMTTLALLAVMSLRQLHWRPGFIDTSGMGAKAFAAGCLGILLMQISLGGWTSSNYSGLVCSDFPTCQGQWFPTMDFSGGFDPERVIPVHGNSMDIPALTAIHWTHRLGALITLILLAGLFWVGYRRRSTEIAAIVMLGLLTYQISIGMGTVILKTPLAMALLHNLFAAGLLISVVTINVRLWLPAALSENRL